MSRYDELRNRARAVIGKTQQVHEEVMIKRINSKIVGRLEMVWRRRIKRLYGADVDVDRWNTKEKRLANMLAKEYGEVRAEDMIERFVGVWIELERRGKVIGVPSIAYLWKVRSKVDNMINGIYDVDDLVKLLGGNQRTSAGHGIESDYKGWDGPKVGW